MRVVSICILTALLISCSKAKNAPTTPPESSDPYTAIPSSISGKPGAPEPKWELLSSGEGASLALETAGQPAIMRLFCPRGENMLKVNVQSFRPVSSEERLTVGSGDSVVTLVAGTQGDPLLGGVSGTGEIPDDLAALVNGQISVNYGAQNSGPHASPPQDLAKNFVTACNDQQTSVEGTEQAVKAPTACLVQDGERLALKARRAIGTEPFWSAKIDGRCVHYSHMDDQKGSRIWTSYSRNPKDEVWSGALNGSWFELRLRNEPGCSDGMSDRTYPSSVELRLGTELRQGCAEPN